MSSTRSVLVAGSALLAASLGYRLFVSPSSSSKSSASRGATEIDDAEQDDFITAQEVAQVFDKLFMEMQSVLSQLMQQIQQIQMAGQNIPEAQLKGLLRDEMTRALTSRQKVVVEDFDMDMECLEEATWEFLEQEDDTVKRAVDRFQKLWENATGEAVAGWRPGKDVIQERGPALEPARLIQVAELYFDALTAAMKSLVDQYKAEGKNLKDPAVQQQLNLDFAGIANDSGEAALSKEGLTLSQFEASVKAHSGNATVGRALGMLQMKQQRELMAIGSS